MLSISLSRSLEDSWHLWLTRITCQNTHIFLEAQGTCSYDKRPRWARALRIVTSISFSLEDRFLLVQLAPPEWPIIVWAIPPFINENASMHGDIKPIKTFTLFQSHTLSSSHSEISASYFSPCRLTWFTGLHLRTCNFDTAGWLNQGREHFQSQADGRHIYGPGCHEAPR